VRARPNPVIRAGLTLAAMLAVAVIGMVLRLVQANGVFSAVKPGFSGTCKSLPIAGVSDIEISGDTAFLAVMNARHPGPEDGIYALNLSRLPRLVRLAGTPADFHPRGIGLYRTANAGLFLLAVNHRSPQASRFSIDSFEVVRQGDRMSLVAQGTIEGGLLTDPQDVAVAGPNVFYVSNGVTGGNRLTRALQGYGILSGGNIVLFNGTLFREVVNGLSGPRGLVLTADGEHVLVASGRNIQSLSREPFTGNLTQAEALPLPAGPDRLTWDDHGNLWAAAHANLFSWRSFGRDAATRAPSQIFRVAVSGGVPRSAEQTYGNDGGEIAGAGVAAAIGKRLLIGSALDGKLLDCAME